MRPRMKRPVVLVPLMRWKVTGLTGSAAGMARVHVVSVSVAEPIGALIACGDADTPAAGAVEPHPTATAAMSAVQRQSRPEKRARRMGCRPPIRGGGALCLRRLLLPRPAAGARSRSDPGDARRSRRPAPHKEDDPRNRLPHA